MSRNKMKVAFLDRDGVINREVNYLHRIKDFEYAPNFIEGIKLLKELKFEIIVVTNQAGIAKGYYTENQYSELTSWYLDDLKKQGIEILDVFHCPHHVDAVVDKYKKACDCRKPATGMFQRAISKYPIDIENSILVGDKDSDIGFGKNSGIKDKHLFLVSTGHEIINQHKTKVFDDLLEVAKYIKEKL